MAAQLKLTIPTAELAPYMENHEVELLVTGDADGFTLDARPVIIGHRVWTPIRRAVAAWVQ